MFDGLAPRSNIADRWELDDFDPINRGMLGWWPLNEGGGGVARDLTAFRRHGTLTNFTSTATSGWGVGPYGRALNFDGTNDHVPVLDFPTPPFITISAWVNAGAGGSGIVLNKNYNGASVPYSLCVANNGTFGGFAFFNGGWRKSGVVTDIRGDGNWHFVVGSYDGATLRYYIDGRLDSSFAYAGTLPTATNAQPPRIGVYLNDGAYYAGAMVALRVHGRALGPSEIMRIYREPWAGAFASGERLFESYKRGSSGTIYLDSFTDSLNSADTTTVFLGAFPSFSDVTSTAESFINSAHLISSLPDSVSSAETILTLLSTASAILDSATIADAIANALSTATTTQDDAESTDNMPGGTAFNSEVSDAATVAEALAENLSVLESAIDATTVAEAFATALGGVASITDIVAIAESLATSLDVSASYIDTATVAELLAANLGVATSIVDAATVAETLALSLGIATTVSDGLTSEGSLTNSLEAVAAFFEEFGAEEAFAHILSTGVSVSDAIALIDSFITSIGLLSSPASRKKTLSARSRLHAVSARVRRIILDS